jgi:parallel beta-helix repeat protein
MHRKLVLIMTLIVIISMLGVALKATKVKASRTVYIRVDGTVEGTDKIQRDGDIYTFTDNICDGIVVERSNIIIKGDEYMLQGTGNGIGFDLTGINNVTIQNMNIKNFRYGIYLNSSHSNSVYRSNITGNRKMGVRLYESSNNIISGNNITANMYCRGIWLSLSSDNTISENLVADNEIGILVGWSSNNNVSGNKITDNSHSGMELSYSSNNVLRNNTIADNQYNFGVYCWKRLSGFVNDVDASNTVDGKPVYYWVNKQNMTVPLDAGYVALVNCTRITVQNLHLTGNEEGVLLAFTTNSTITGTNITNNYYGILSSNSSDNSVSENNIANNEVGIDLSLSNNNRIYKNKITENRLDGISLGLSSDNNISGNNITETRHHGIKFITSSNNSIEANKIANNEYGIHLSHSSNNNTILENDIVENNRPYYHGSPTGLMITESANNAIFHNNFLNNICHASNPKQLANFWDDGIEGNYWSGYNGNDTAHDGIGDSSYKIADNNVDHYPLMGMFHSFNTSLGYNVDVISNSTIDDFEYFESNSTIKTCVSNMTTGQTFGFCRVCIPRTLMNPDGISVIIDDGQTPVLHYNHILHDNDTHRWIYLAYEHATHKIEIIPEFPSFLILPLFMIATLVVVIVYRRKQYDCKTSSQTGENGNRLLANC